MVIKKRSSRGKKRLRCELCCLLSFLTGSGFNAASQKEKYAFMHTVPYKGALMFLQDSSHISFISSAAKVSLCAFNAFTRPSQSSPRTAPCSPPTRPALSSVQIQVRSQVCQSNLSQASSLLKQVQVRSQVSPDKSG